MAYCIVPSSLCAVIRLITVMRYNPNLTIVQSFAFAPYQSPVSRAVTFRESSQFELIGMGV